MSKNSIKPEDVRRLIDNVTELCLLNANLDSIVKALKSSVLPPDMMGVIKTVLKSTYRMGVEHGAGEMLATIAERVEKAQKSK